MCIRDQEELSSKSNSLNKKKDFSFYCRRLLKRGGIAMSDKLEKVGKGVQGCGCIIILIPVLIVLLFIVFSLIKSLF